MQCRTAAVTKRRFYPQSFGLLYAKRSSKPLFTSARSNLNRVVRIWSSKGNHVQAAFRSFSAILATVLMSAAFAPTAHAADEAWGPWQKTEKCRTLRMQVGPNRDLLESPRTPGVPQAYECIWERIKNDCPKVSSKLRHPIKCFIRRQKSDWSVSKPNS